MSDGYSTHVYHLLLSPPQAELLDVVHDLGRHLLDAAPDGWSEPEDDGSAWVSTQGNARIRLREPKGDVPGFIELAGFPEEGRVRWAMGAPPRLVLSNLSDDVVDVVWGRMRAQQAETLRRWIRTRGANKPIRTGRTVGGFASLFRAFHPDGGAIPADLPFLTQPPFAPDDAPVWLFKGELSSLPREVDAIGHPVAGVAHENSPTERLLVRAVHRLGAQTIVPMLKLRRGHRPVGGTSSSGAFATAQILCRTVCEPLSSYMGGIELKMPTSTMDQDTAPAPVYLTRFAALEQTDTYPFKLSGGVAKVPRSDVTVRLLEVRSAFAPVGEPEAILELSVDGLKDGAQVHVTATQRPAPMGSKPRWEARSFVIGPPKVAEDIQLLVERALG